MSKSIEQSIKQKLKNIEKVQGIPFNRLLDTLFLERILARVSSSSSKDKLIFKGGLCLAQFLELGRGTKDIDFLINELDENESSLKVIFSELSKINLNDGFAFSDTNVKQISLTDKKFPGFRITITGNLGKISNKVQIDVGVGDVVRPKILDVALLKDKVPLFEDSVELYGYPVEYIFSEKLEAIINLGNINSRMKDFYDCYKMVQENVLDPALVKLAIDLTFKTRNTTFELIPVGLVLDLEKRWSGFLRKEIKRNIELKDVVSEINLYLKATVLED
jgi:predicted nucleotidyltransferase component of viral defense system